MGKLVRDKIIQIIKDSGRDPKYKVLSQKDYKNSLRKKLLEESQEVVEAKSKKELAEEIADVQEVLECLKKAYGLRSQDVKKIQNKKRKERGSFLKKLFLI